MKQHKLHKEIEHIKRIAKYGLVGEDIKDYMLNDKGQKILRTQQNTIQRKPK